MRSFTVSGMMLSVWLCGCAGAGLAQGPSAPAEQAITLEQAIGYALKQNRELALVRLAADTRRVDVAEAAARFEFNVTPSVGMDTADHSQTLSGGLAVGRLTTQGTQVELGVNATQTKTDGSEDVLRDSIALEIQQPLLRHAGRLMNEEPWVAAGSAVQAGRRELELRKTDVVVRVAEVHEELLKLQRQQEAGTETIRRLDRMVRLTQARERQGRATRVDVLRGEQKLGSARQRQTGIDQQLTSRRADFSELLGFEPGTVFIAEVAPVPKVDVTGVEEALVVALRHRLDYAQLQQDEQDAARGMRIARRNLLPNLDIVTRYEKAGSGADASAAAKLDEDIWLVGLSSSSDLPMRSERLAVERAGLAREAAAIRMEAVRATVDRQVRQAASVYRRSVLDTETTARNYRLAERGAQLAQRMFERGRGDSFTLSNAEDERQSTEDVWLNAQAGEMIAAYHLLRVLGTLIEYPADLMPLMGGQP